ncbi:hypothetical protein MSG28_010597 [Choristoneura fumiferana]|uniref:Uncharacterized protein n=1 Tax=Choristoneura fumiferana TaxID=7141 RepID=A0ACC0KN19_CHOFU|nr:hypothetical protein MSG28_010597 [Choristoneura fumiferana]
MSAFGKSIVAKKNAPQETWQKWLPALLGGKSATTSFSPETRRVRFLYAKIVVLWEQKQPIKKIARDMGVTRKTVRRWIQRYQATGDVKCDRQGPRPVAYTDESERHRNIVQVHSVAPFKSTRSSAETFGVSLSTVRRHLHAANIHNYKPPEKLSLLTITEPTELLGMDVFNGPGELVEIGGRMNSERYLEVLKDVMLPSVRVAYPEGQIYLVHDNSSVHKSKIVKDWLNSQKDITVFEWPAKSPDLNPIENLWGQMVLNWDSSEIRSKKNLDNENLAVLAYYLTKVSLVATLACVETRSAAARAQDRCSRRQECLVSDRRTHNKTAKVSTPSNARSPRSKAQAQISAAAIKEMSRAATPAQAEPVAH